MNVTPPKASAKPTQRRQPTISPRNTIERNVAKGTLSCTTTAATDASVSAIPLNISAK